MSETWVDTSELERLGGRIEPPPSGGASVTISAVDPGAIGAGNLWLRLPALSLGVDFSLLIRDATNTSWLELGLAHFDGLGNLLAQVQLGDTGAEILVQDPVGGTFGDVFVQNDGVIAITSLGATGGVTILMSAAGLTITQASAASPIVIGDAPDHPIGFYGHAAAARQVVPAVPAAQDVVDALVAIGLIEQSA